MFHKSLFNTNPVNQCAQRTAITNDDGVEILNKQVNTNENENKKKIETHLYFIY